MPNHYHLVVETPTGGLARAIRYLNGVYAQAFNRRHGRTGHLFQGRYTAILIQRERHLLELARYVVLNPVRAGLCRHPAEFAWSSYRATVGLEPPPPLFDVAWLRSRFGADSERSRAAYTAFVEDGTRSLRPVTKPRGIVLGDEAFLARAMDEAKATPEVPQVERAPLRPSLATVLREYSDEGLAPAHREHGFTLREIAEHLGCHYSTVSRRLRAWEEGRKSAPRRRRGWAPP